MNRTYQYPYITEGYRNYYMSCARHHTMGEWYKCAVRLPPKKTVTVLKIHQHITTPSPAGHQPLW